MKKKFMIVLPLIIAIICSMSLFGVTVFSAEQVNVYAVEDFDKVSNLDFKETTFQKNNVTKVTKGKDRYGVYYDISMRINEQWASAICQFPLPVDVTNTKFSYEILSPQTTYWLIVGVASRQITQEVETAGAYWSLSQEKDLENNTLANRGVLGMYLDKANLSWQKGLYYKKGNGTSVKQATFTENKKETIEIKKSESDLLQVKVSNVVVPTQAKVTDFENNLGYIQFESSSSAANQSSKVRLRFNEVDLGEDFVEEDLTDYIASDITIEDFFASMDNTHADYKIAKGTDTIGDYYDILFKFKNAWSVTSLQFPMPLNVIDSVKGNLSFSYRFLDNTLPYWFGVGVSGSDMTSFVNFTEKTGSPSAFGLYFPDTAAQYQLLWNQGKNDFNVEDLVTGKVATGLSYTKEHYAHIQMQKTGEKIGVKVNDTNLDTSDYSSVFKLNKGYITFMACSQNRGESGSFRFRVGTTGTEDYTNEAAPTDFGKPVQSITLKFDNKVMSETDTIKMKKGEEKTLTVIVTPMDAEYDVINFTSAKEAVATVKASGKISAKSVGETTLTITVGGVSRTIKVAVQDAPVIDDQLKTPNKTMLIVVICAVLGTVFVGGGVGIVLVLKQKK